MTRRMMTATTTSMMMVTATTMMTTTTMMIMRGGCLGSGCPACMPRARGLSGLFPTLCRNTGKGKGKGKARRHSGKHRAASSAPAPATVVHPAAPPPVPAPVPVVLPSLFPRAPPCRQSDWIDVFCGGLFPFLGRQSDLVRLREVSRKWKRFISQPTVWARCPVVEIAVRGAKVAAGPARGRRGASVPDPIALQALQQPWMSGVKALKLTTPTDGTSAVGLLEVIQVALASMPSLEALSLGPMGDDNHGWKYDIFKAIRTPPGLLEISIPARFNDEWCINRELCNSPAHTLHLTPEPGKPLHAALINLLSKDKCKFPEVRVLSLCGESPKSATGLDLPLLQKILTGFPDLRALVLRRFPCQLPNDWKSQLIGDDMVCEEFVIDVGANEALLSYEPGAARLVPSVFKC
jgi:hypothetical protein